MNEQIKKKMTKKALKKFYAMNRSRVGLGRNLGGRVMNTEAVYDRKRQRETDRQMFRDL